MSNQLGKLRRRVQRINLSKNQQKRIKKIDAAIKAAENQDPLVYGIKYSEMTTYLQSIIDGKNHSHVQYVLSEDMTYLEIKHRGNKEKST
jgi:hypothetical protein